jgi:hypothetical protein
VPASLRAYVGDLQGTYALLARQKGRPRALAHVLSGRRTLNVLTAEIAAAQYEHGSCRRMDLFVRLLAIEEHAGANDFGLQLYRRFVELKSAAQGRAAPSHTTEAFLELVESVRAVGLSPASPLAIHPDKVLRHGMHRFACAVYFGLETVPAVVDARRLSPPNYTLERLRELGLEEQELAAVAEAEAHYARAWAEAAAPR